MATLENWYKWLKNEYSFPENEYPDKDNCLIIFVVVDDGVVLIRVDELNVYKSPLPFPF